MNKKIFSLITVVLISASFYFKVTSVIAQEISIPKNLTFLQNSIPLWKEDFSYRYTATLSPMLESKTDFAQNDLLGNYCELYLKFPVSDQYRNLGVLKDCIIFPNCSYFLRAEIFIPNQSKFYTNPGLYVLDENFNAISKNLLPANFSRDKIITISLQFSITGNSIRTLHLALTSQINKNSNENESIYYLKTFELFQINEYLPQKTYSYKTQYMNMWGDYSNENNFSTFDSIASKYSFYVSGMMDRLSAKPINRYLHRLNPNIKILFYFNSEALYENTEIIKYVESTHPEWFIRDNNNNFVAEISFPAHRIMDVTNAEYREWITDILSSKANDGEFDGVFFDVVCAYLYSPYYSSETLFSSLNGQINSDLWRDSFIALINLLKYKSGKLIIGNGIGLSHGTQYYYAKANSDKLITALDGFMIEVFAVDKKNGVSYRKSDIDLENDIKMLREVSNLGKFIFVSGRVWKKSDIPSNDPELQNFYISKFNEGSNTNCYLRLEPTSITKY